MKNIHFISIGGAIMHSLAIALKGKGYNITGSDDEIFEPSKSALVKHNLLPEVMGWNETNIHTGLDAVILGMHAKADNPELLKAQALGIKIYSFPEFVYEASKNKQRIAICGSHGKTTITSMILHVLKYNKREFDYLVGSSIAGFEDRVKLSDAPIIILEGDEYLSSPLDKTPKFLKYHHHIAVVSGIAWDHINVFPTKELYNDQFLKLIDATPRSGKVIFNEDDLLLTSFCHKDLTDVGFKPYSIHPHKIKDGETFLETKKDGEIAIKVFGEHNLYNISAAKEVCAQVGITDSMFYQAISTFEGAKNRLELIRKNDNSVFYKDFAHAPSKLMATVEAMKQQFPKRKLVACVELHTFSSLNKDFISEYEGAFDQADKAIVYINPLTFEHKKLTPFTASEIQKAFDNKDVIYTTDIQEVEKEILDENYSKSNLLMMTSGNFAGMDLNKLADKIYK